MNIRNVVDLFNRLLNKLGILGDGPQGEKLGWSIKVVDDSEEIAEGVPGCCSFKTKTIYMRLSALNGGLCRGIAYTPTEVVCHEIAHILRGGPEHDSVFDSHMELVELLAADIDKELRDGITDLEPEKFTALAHASIKKVVTAWTAEQYSAAVWNPKSGLVLHQLVSDAIHAGALQESDLPGHRITPPCPKRAEN